MKRITLGLTVLAFGCLTFNSCIFDAKEAKKDDTPVETGFKPLDQRDNVLFNLALAYNQSNIEEYDKLLDEKFIFHFSFADFSGGTVNVEQWDRAAELGATANMFNPSFSPPNGAPISSITLTMNYPQGEDNWNAQQSSPDSEYPNETQYVKTVAYLLTVVAGETTYTSGNPIDAQFVVRLADVGGEEFYRVVTWKDDI